MSEHNPFLCDQCTSGRTCTKRAPIGCKHLFTFNSRCEDCGVTVCAQFDCSNESGSATFCPAHTNCPCGLPTAHNGNCA